MGGTAFNGSSLMRSIPIILGSWALFGLSMQSAANPIAGPPVPFDTSFSVGDNGGGLLWLFLLNILVNLFWICVLFFVLGHFYGQSMGRLTESASIFLVIIIGSAIVVTTIGAIVDFMLILQPDRAEYDGLRYFSFDLGYWVLALLLIFLSVVLCFRFFLGVRIVPLLILGGTMVAMNLAWWIMSWQFGYEVPLFTIIFGALAVPILLRSLFYWYADQRASALAAAVSQ